MKLQSVLTVSIESYIIIDVSVDLPTNHLSQKQNQVNYDVNDILISLPAYCNNLKLVYVNYSYM